MSTLLLNEEEMRHLSQIMSDHQTGNHLIRLRSDEYRDFVKRFLKAQAKAENLRSEKESQMIEYYKACDDFNEYQNFCNKYGIK